MTKAGGSSEKKKESKRKERSIIIERVTRQRTGSLGSIADSFKRKREEEDEEDRIKAEKEFYEIFRKSRIVDRTPPHKKEEETEESRKIQKGKKIGDKEETDMDKLEQITEIMLTIKKDTEEIKKENKEIKAELQVMREEWKRRQEEWVKEKKIMEERLNELETKEEQMEMMIARMKQLERKDDERERRERRNNIIMKGEGIPTEGSPKEIIKQTLRQELQIEADIEDAYWIKREQGRRMLVAKLGSWQQKKEILIKKSKMKGKKLYIDNDLTKKERDVQKEITGIARTKREQGEEVKIGYKKLIANGKTFIWEEEEGMKEINFRNKDRHRPRREKHGTDKITRQNNKGDENWLRNKRKKQYTRNKLKKDDAENTKEIKVIFWNTAGIARKDKDFWEYVRKFKIVNLTETWNKMEAWMPKEFKWEIQYATRDKKKGRGSGGMIVGVKKNIRMETYKKKQEE
ncbi:vicilin-like seed storage protein At2g18540 [Ooceraea biroi]|uniref:vicilin-like seed storage protein At2g18540 n=1 Tax=Ooceraea biroi TaxID=2015173 RepID=UPI000F07B22D|nr:vicilin-like seed storage protein At2g18540 [Ooceraea biroi]